MRYLVIVWWHEPIIGEYDDLDAARKDYDRAQRELESYVTLASVITTTATDGGPLDEWIFKSDLRRK